MANRAHLLGALLSLTAALAAQQGRATRTAQLIAAGTRWRTSAVVIDSGVSGPTALVVGGVHGNEPAGYRAARQASGWRVAKGKLVVIPRAKVVASDDMPFAWVRQQFPLQLCFAMTINRSQGQTLRSRVGVVLTSGVWTHGMAYVALGRVTDPANLRVAAPGNGKVIVNVVYRDVLAVGEARGAV